MREPEFEPARIVFVDPCAICGKDMARQEPKVWISVRYKNSGAGTMAAHVNCVRPLVTDQARRMLDPDKLVSEADESDA